MRFRSTRPRTASWSALGISESDVPALRAILERAVPKNRGGEFLDLIEELANDAC